MKNSVTLSDNEPTVMMTRIICEEMGKTIINFVRGPVSEEEAMEDLEYQASCIGKIVDSSVGSFGEMNVISIYVEFIVPCL